MLSLIKSYQLNSIVLAILIIFLIHVPTTQAVITQNSITQSVAECTIQTFYRDNDNDTYGDPTYKLTTCAVSTPSGYVLDNTDCNDYDNTIYQTIIFYLDNDQDTVGDSNIQITACVLEIPSGYVVTNNDCNDNDNTVTANQTYYKDNDGDGKGDATAAISQCVSTPPTGYVTDNTDTNDTDFDNDGVSTESDCNDADATVASTITYYVDADGDGLGNPTTAVTACMAAAPAGTVTNGNDTDDTSNGSNDDQPGDNDDQPSDVTIVDVRRIKGGIEVEYSDGTVKQFVLFDSDKKTRFKQLNDHQAFVVHPQGKIVQLIDLKTGTVRDQIQVSNQGYRNINVQIKKVYDHKVGVISMTSKKHHGKVILFDILGDEEKVKRRSTIKLDQGINPDKTKITNKKVKIFRRNGVATYRLTKEIRLKAL